MASIFQQIRNKLTIPVHDYKVNTQIFADLNPETVAIDLDIDNLGNENGKNEIPATGDSGLDNVESLIEEKLTSANNQAYELAINELQSYSERLSYLKFDKVFNQILMVTPNEIADFVKVRSEKLNDMNIMRKDLKFITDEFQYFRKKNLLEHRSAKLPSQFTVIFGSLLIIILSILEIYMNAIFLKEGSEGGLLGGINLAVGFTFLNIGFSLLIGNYGIRQLFHINILRKLIGLISLISFSGLIFIINLALAHYRNMSSELIGSNYDNYIQRVTEIQEKIIEKLISNPFNLPLDGWLLFGIGSLFAVIALFDILNLSDFYPGYTSVWKKYVNSIKDYRDEFEYCSNDLKDKRDIFNNDIFQLLNSLNSAQREIDNIQTAQRRLLVLYKQFNEHLSDTGNVLYSRYYLANSNSRQTAPPARFNSTPKIKIRELNNDEFFQSKDFTNIGKDYAKVQKILEEGNKKVNEEFAKSITELNTLDKLDSKV